MVRAFWILAALDAVALLTLLVVGVTEKGHSDGGREMGLAFLVVLPLAVLGITAGMFAAVTLPVVRWICLGVVVLPLGLLGYRGLDHLRFSRSNDPVNSYSTDGMKNLVKAIDRLDVDEVKRLAPGMDKDIDQGLPYAPLRMTIDKMVKEQQTRVPAQTERHLAILKILLENGAKPNEAMQVACWTKSGELFAALFRAGADPNYSAQYSGPVFFGCLDNGLGVSGSVVPMVKEFIAAGVDVNRKSNSGFLPAAYAVNCSQFDAVLYLLDHGADPDAKDERGDSMRSEVEKKMAEIQKGNSAVPAELLELARRLAK